MSTMNTDGDGQHGCVDEFKKCVVGGEKMEDYQNRVVIERQELGEKITKLLGFVLSASFDDVDEAVDAAYEDLIPQTVTDGL